VTYSFFVFSDLYFFNDQLNGTLAYDILLIACNAMGYCGDGTDQFLKQTVIPGTKYKSKIFL